MSQRTTRQSRSDLDPAPRASPADALAAQLASSARVSPPYRTAVMSDGAGPSAAAPQQQPPPAAAQQQQQQQQPLLSAAPKGYTNAFGDALRNGVNSVLQQQAQSAATLTSLGARVGQLATQVANEAKEAATSRKTMDDSMALLEASVAG